jgi:hypothetical protein
MDLMDAAAMNEATPLVASFVPLITLAVRETSVE